MYFALLWKPSQVLHMVKSRAFRLLGLQSWKILSPIASLLKFSDIMISLDVVMTNQFTG